MSRSVTPTAMDFLVTSQPSSSTTTFPEVHTAGKVPKLDMEINGNYGNGVDNRNTTSDDGGNPTSDTLPEDMETETDADGLHGDEIQNHVGENGRHKSPNGTAAKCVHWDVSCKCAEGDTTTSDDELRDDNNRVSGLEEDLDCSDYKRAAHLMERSISYSAVEHTNTIHHDAIISSSPCAGCTRERLRGGVHVHHHHHHSRVLSPLCADASGSMDLGLDSESVSETAESAVDSTADSTSTSQTLSLSRKHGPVTGKPPLPSNVSKLKVKAGRQSWLLRLFESRMFDMSIAISYLFNSKEPGVQTYLGKFFREIVNIVNIYI
jgi:hypothetical protein